MSILDALYYGRIETKSYLVHMDHSVIKAMAVFVYFGVVKDVFFGLLIIFFTGINPGMDS